MMKKILIALALLMLIGCVAQKDPELQEIAEEAVKEVKESQHIDIGQKEIEKEYEIILNNTKAVSIEQQQHCIQLTRGITTPLDGNAENLTPKNLVHTTEYIDRCSDINVFNLSIGGVKSQLDMEAFGKCSIENEIVTCDSRLDGNGDGICQSGETCIKAYVTEDKIKTLYRNSQKYFTEQEEMISPRLRKQLPKI